MILPDKHIKFGESIFGLGAIIVKLLDKSCNIDELWKKFEKVNNTKFLPVNHTFDNFLITVDYLFMIGAIHVDERGKLSLCDS